MQKVVGSSPIIRSSKAPLRRGFRLPDGRRSDRLQANLQANWFHAWLRRKRLVIRLEAEGVAFDEQGRASRQHYVAWDVLVERVDQDDAA